MDLDLKELIKENTVTEDFIKKHKLEQDFNITINEAADILGYSVPHFQTFVLPYLLQAKAEPEGYVKQYMFEKTKNMRIKKVVSRESLINYIGVMMSVQKEYETMYLSREDAWFDELKEYVKTRRNIQLALNKAAIEINGIYGKSKDKISDEKRLQKRLTQLREGNINILHFMEANSFDLKEVKRFYVKSNFSDKKCWEKDGKDIFSILKENMYSIRQIKDEYEFKHIQQVYRFIEKVSGMQIKIADTTAITATSLNSDRNIRYILKDKKELAFSKKHYYIRLSKQSYDKIKSISEMTGGFTSVEQMVKHQIEARIRNIKFDDEDKVE